MIIIKKKYVTKDLKYCIKIPLLETIFFIVLNLEMKEQIAVEKCCSFKCHCHIFFVLVLLIP